MKLATTKEIAEYLQLRGSYFYGLSRRVIPVIYIGEHIDLAMRHNNWLANGN